MGTNMVKVTPYRVYFWHLIIGILIKILPVRVADLEGEVPGYVEEEAEICGFKIVCKQIR